MSPFTKNVKIPSEKFVIEMLNFGNTVSSTIPIAFVEHQKNFPEKKKRKGKKRRKKNGTRDLEYISTRLNLNMELLVQMLNLKPVILA